jgi:hypothetical protein
MRRPPKPGFLLVAQREWRFLLHDRMALILTFGVPQFALTVSFNAREDLLHGLAVGTAVAVARPGARDTIPAVVTEARPLGVFATWQAERAVGDHNRNTLRLRLDLRGDPTGLEPGMTVWLSR